MKRVHFSRSVTVRFSSEEYERFEQAMFWHDKKFWKVSDHVREAVRFYCHLVQNTHEPAKVAANSAPPSKRKTPRAKRRPRAK